MSTLELLATFEPDDAPQAQRDPVRGPVDLLALAALVVRLPLEYETIVIGLDDWSRGSKMMVVTGTVAPDDVIDVARFVGEAQRSSVAHAPSAIALMSVRPGAADDPDDVERRQEIERLLEPMTLAHWLILGEHVTCVPAAAPPGPNGAPPHASD